LTWVSLAVTFFGACSMSSRITLKLMAELPDEAAALRFKNRVEARIAAFGSIKQWQSKRCRRTPDWFEVFFFLQPSTDPKSAFDGILSSLGKGWERHDISTEEEWATWNPNEGSSFFSSHVRWANLERFPDSAVVSF
jgi:hypothetical protein